MKVANKPPRAHPHVWLGILGVLIALSTPVIQALLVPWFKSTFPFPMDRFASLWVFWIAVLLVLGIAHLTEGYPLATFGFQWSRKTLRARLIEWILTTLATVVVASVMIFFSTYVRNLLTDAPAPGLEMVRLLPAWVLVPAWITGSFTEEVLYRSYPIERLTQLTGQRWLASLITIVAFTGLHLLSWDWIHVLTVVLPGSIMLTLFYLWRRSLALNVLIHAIINAPLLLLPVLATYM
ncbi:MAG: CPBP family intramembrane metalloprotease [Anaerolineales bacterium]|nr:CPBP family intramembrane metalloprotease [Anaerolineales bacterium]